MLSELSLPFDPVALGIVLCGTLLATVVRSGSGDLRHAKRALHDFLRRPFDEDANRIAIARTVRAVERDGVLRADPGPPPDAAFAHLIDVLVKHRSLELMREAERAQHAARDEARAAAVRTFETAGDLAPVFGLVGTLFAITQLAPGSAAVLETTLSSLATAALSTLYGVLAAHLVLIPLARAVDRRCEREEAARTRLFAWLVDHLEAMHGNVFSPLREAA